MKTANQNVQEVRNQMINVMNVKIQHFESILNPGCSIIERCNQIVEIGGYTVGCDENKKVTLELTHNPMQFSSEGVKEIMKGTYKNYFGENIIPKVYFARDWYRKELEIAKETLDLIHKANK